jgi:hypothetical protein
MENFSETEKHKGGRPRKYSKEFLTGMRAIYSDYNTDRSINNMIYLGDAQKLLMNSDEFTYLVDNKKQKLYRTTILTALGRVADMYTNGEEMMLQLARIICDDKMTTSEAIYFINNYRKQDGQKLNKNSITGTFKKILTVIRNSNLDDNDMKILMKALRKLSEEDLLE